MLVTVAIINYNYGRFLEKAIESALVQAAEATEVEVLVIDDGSTDESEVVFASYAGHPRIRISRSGNSGFGASLGRAVLEARGEWVMLLDADDWFEPQKLRIIRPHLTPEKGSVKNANRFVDESGRASGKTGAAGNTSTLTIFRKKALEILPVDDESGFYLFELCNLNLTVPDALTIHRIHGASMASQTRYEYERRGACYRSMMRKLATWGNQSPSWVSASHRKNAARVFHGMAVFASTEAAICAGQRWKALRNAMSFWLLTRNHKVGLRAIARAVLLRPLPSREHIFLS